MEKNMKRLLIMIFVLCVVSTTYSQTQSKLNETAEKSSMKSDQEMEVVLKKIAFLYKDKKLFLEKLRVSQECWLKFRKAQLDALYPAKDKQAAYGSVFPTAYASEKDALNKLRIKQLMVWINGIEEGNVGAGSVKFKSQFKK
jgi:uncharacterized protein YecT (DUF1311 family)